MINHDNHNDKNNNINNINVPKNTNVNAINSKNIVSTITNNDIHITTNGSEYCVDKCDNINRINNVGDSTNTNTPINESNSNNKISNYGQLIAEM